MKRTETHRDPPLPCLSGRVHSNHGGIFIIPAPAPAATARPRHGRGKSSTLNFSEERSSPSTAWYSLASGRCLLPAAPSSPARQPFYNDFFCVATCNLLPACHSTRDRGETLATMRNICKCCNFGTNLLKNCLLLQCLIKTGLELIVSLS